MTDQKTPTLPQTDMSAAETARAEGERANADYEVGEWVEQQRMTLTKAARRALVDLILFARQSAAIDAGRQEAPGKWCTHCRKDNHSDSECWSTRAIGAHDAHPAPMQMPTAFAWPKEISALASCAEAPPASAALIEEFCALIKAADDAAADKDYMLDSDDCISVLRGTWKAPLANDCPPAPAAALSAPPAVAHKTSRAAFAVIRSLIDSANYRAACALGSEEKRVFADERFWDAIDNANKFLATEPPPVAAVAQPMFFASPEQAHALEDRPGDNEGGRYLPVRKTEAGKFTMPLYAAPAVVAKPGTWEDGAEKYLADIISRSPEPLRELGDWLAKRLDEDDWKTAERYVLGAMNSIAALAASPSCEQSADAFLRQMASMSGTFIRSSRDLDPQSIADARASCRWLTLRDGLGFAIMAEAARQAAEDQP